MFSYGANVSDLSWIVMYPKVYCKMLFGLPDELNFREQFVVLKVGLD